VAQEDTQEAAASGGGGGDKGLLGGVPPLFAKILIGALDVDILTKHQVVTFVEKFSQRDELVLAAWSIFEMQQDMKDLIDTLYKIYRVYQEKEAAEAEVASAKQQQQQKAQAGGDDDDDTVSENEEETPPAPAVAAPSAGGEDEEAEEELDAGMAQLMAILDQCMELLEKREEIREKQAGGSGGGARPALTAEAVACVKALGKAKDPLLIAVLADFSEKRDVDQLLDHLYVIALETQAGNVLGNDGGSGGEGDEKEDAEDDRAAAAAAAASGVAESKARQEQREEVEEEQEETASSATASSTSPHQLDVSETQQKTMIIEAMLAERIVDELEKQALEVLVLKQDREVGEAFAHFFAAQGPQQKLAALEQLSLGLKRLAKQELDRLRAAISGGDDEDEDDEQEGREGEEEEDANGIEMPAMNKEGERGLSGSVEMTAVTITEDEEESFEEDDSGAGGDDDKEEEKEEDAGGGGASPALAAMSAALASTLEHLGLSSTVKQALLSAGDDERVMMVAAIDVFQQTKDVGDLKDTLKRIARQFMDKQHAQRLEV
jgi:hypothetical protein